HRIGRAEVWLREKGLREVRVRHFLENDAPQARIEIEPSEMSQIFAFWSEVGPTFREWGFESVLLDLEGYKRGKMNVAAKVESAPIQLFL
ncbi:MAG TPA: hypothetical protein VGB45_15415, partial [Abditibacterium sp.]